MSATAQRISRLLKNEFSFRVDGGFEENFEQASESLAACRLLDRSSDETWSIAPDGRSAAEALSGLLAPFFEAYRLTAGALDEARDRAIGERKFIALALGIARRRVTERAIRAEAALQPTIKHSLAVLKAEGAMDSSGGVRLADADKRDALVAEFSRYLTAG